MMFPALALVASTMLTALAPSEFRGLVALACACIVLLAVLTFRVIKVAGAISASPILGFVPSLAVTWPVTVIYFSLVSPDSVYLTLLGPVAFLLRADVLILAVLVFTAGYGIGLAPILLGRRKPAPAPYSERPSDSEWWIAAVGTIANTLGCLANLVGVQGPVLFVANVLHNYLWGLVFPAGYRWRTLTRGRRLFMTVTLAATGILYTIANARGLAVLPIAFVIGGYLISPEATRRARVTVVTLTLLLTPIYAVIGNQTRIALQSIGFENFEQRASVLAESLSGDIVYEKGGFLEDTMGRLFSTGGHALVAIHWDRMTLQDFDVDLFARESVTAMVPAVFLKPEERERQTGNAMLRQFGFMITDETGVEVSLIGSLCAAGGPEFIALGGLFVGLLHLALIRIIARFRTRPWALPFAGSMFAAGLIVHTFDLIQLVRTYFWACICVGIALQVCVLLEHLLKGALISNTRIGIPPAPPPVRSGG